MVEEMTPAPTIIYDHRDAISHEDPWPRWAQMRTDNPIFFTEAYDGFYLLPRYHEVTDAVGNTDVFSSAIGKTMIPAPPVPNLPPIHTDPPDTRPWRDV